VQDEPDDKAGRPDAAPQAAGEMPCRRQYRRARVLWGATLAFDVSADEVACTVVDISAGGAKLMLTRQVLGNDPDLLTALMPGERVTLSVRASGTVPAAVVWQNDDRLGVRFLLDPESVRERFPGVVPPT
jgi:hypothetical protein